MSVSEHRNGIKLCFRYEIYVPLNYNDGTLVEPEKVYQTTQELMMKFKGLTTYPVSLKASGLWEDGNGFYQDELILYRVDIEAKFDLLDFIIGYKDKLKDDYKQVEIYITRQRIEII